MQGVEILFMTIATNYLVFAQNTYEKALDVNGRAYCATEYPSDIFQVSNIASEFECIPLAAQCALQCEMNFNCTAFNVKNAAGQCEFYDYLPPLCCIVPYCIHFKVCFSKLFPIILFSPQVNSNSNDASDSRIRFVKNWRFTD